MKIAAIYNAKYNLKPNKDRSIKNQIYQLKELKRDTVSFGNTSAKIDIKSAQDIFNTFGIDTKIRKDGKLIISHYTQPKNSNFNELGIDEDELLKNVAEIEGDADFLGSNATTLGSIESIEGDLDIINSSIEDLGELKYIGGDAWFTGWRHLGCPGGDTGGRLCHCSSARFLYHTRSHGGGR